MAGLEQFDDALDTVPGNITPAWKRAVKIFNGTYTLQLPDGTHRTFRIRTKAETSRFAPGKRIIELLTGPDNTTDYTGFGFVDDTGIHVWKSKCGAPGKPSRFEEYTGLLWDLANGEEVEGCVLMMSGTCLRCNRPLTDPESIAVGIGPTCRGKA